MDENDIQMDLLALSLSSPAHLYAASSSSAAVADDGDGNGNGNGPTAVPPLPNFFYPPLIPVPDPDPPQNHPTPAQRRPRRNPTGTPPPGKSATIPPPYPWAGNRRCIVQTLAYLRSQNIFFISGEVQCKKCESRYSMQFNLEEKFREIANFIAQNIGQMKDRAPKPWMSPALPDCRRCGENNSARPVISDKKISINWLFLFLGQMVGCCTLNQLKYFCKHTLIHRTGAKDRLVFSTYMKLFSQLQPNGPSDV